MKYLLEQLPRADSVPGIYEASYFPRSSTCLTVARNPKGSCRSQGYSGKRNPSDMFSFLNSKHRSGLTLDHSCRPSLEADLPLTMRFRRMVETCRSSLQGKKLVQSVKNSLTKQVLYQIEMILKNSDSATFRDSRPRAFCKTAI